MRLNLCNPLESRDGTLAKDARMKNLLVENIEGMPTAIKRPGVVGNVEPVTGGLGQGLVSFGGLYYAMVDDELLGPFNPANGWTGWGFGSGYGGAGSVWSPLYEYEEGAEVTHEGDTYTALQGSQGQTPATVSAFWQVESGFVATYHSMPSAGTWVAVAYGAGVFCAITETGEAATSTNGITWTSRTFPDPVDVWVDIAWNGSVFCAADTEGRAATSADGITWVTRTVPVGVNAIAAGGSRFCALRGLSASYISDDDGVSWVAGIGPGLTARAITWNGSAFCVVGTNPVGPTGRSAISADGQNWTLGTLSNAQWKTVAWNGSVFCAFASNNGEAAAVSSDGLSWSVSSVALEGSLVKVVAAGSVFYAIGTNDVQAFTSPNGTSWTASTLSTNPWQDSVYNGTIIVAICYSSSVVAVITP